MARRLLMSSRPLKLEKLAPMCIPPQPSQGESSRRIQQHQHRKHIFTLMQHLEGQVPKYDGMVPGTQYLYMWVFRPSTGILDVIEGAFLS